MDTDEKYRDRADFYVRFAGEREPDFVADYFQRRIDDPDDPLTGRQGTPLRDHHLLNEDVPIDGQVTFYFPDVLDDADETGLFAFSFPFRSAEKTDAPWFARPDAEKFSRHPVWKWENPEADRDDITLSPSLGVGREALVFHCFIEDGDVRWV